MRLRQSDLGSRDESNRDESSRDESSRDESNSLLIRHLHHLFLQLMSHRAHLARL